MAHLGYDTYNYLQPENDRSLISTLFVSGLPDDVKAREIHNLFRRCPGFDSCQLKYTGRGNQVVAFATFFNHHSAVAALHSLNGVKFDPQTGSCLHIELAKSNSRRKRNPVSGPYVVIDNRNKPSTNNQETSSDDGEGNQDEGGRTAETNTMYSDGPVNTISETGANPGDVAIKYVPQEKISDDAKPCSTLFIANLGPTCSEEELKQVLSLYAGFNVLKLQAKGGMPVAFADFEESEQATRVMADLQGSLLPSSDRGGLHIEYARSKMRKPK